MCYISFCISSYERKNMLIELIEHLLSCSSKDIEVAVVDDCSKKKKKKALAAISDKRFRYRVNHDNRGAALCWYDALEFGQGKWLFQLLDRDWIDIQLIDKLVKILHKLESSGVGFAVAGEQFNGAKDFQIFTKGLETQKEFALRDSHPTGQIFRRDCWRKIENRKQYFSNQEYGIYPHGYLYAILGNHYAGAQIYPDICAKRNYRERYAKTVSRVYETRTDKMPWFYPEQGMRFLKLACEHIGLIRGMEEQQQVSKCCYIRFSQFVTLLYYNACIDEVVKQRYHCEHLSTDYIELMNNLFSYIYEVHKYFEEQDFIWKNEYFYYLLSKADQEILDRWLPWIESVRIMDQKEQAFEKFEHFSENKKIFIFGLGKQFEVLCDTYLKECFVEGVIDNDIQKQGMEISAYCSYAENIAFKNNRIMQPEVLLNYNAEDTVVIITSIRSYMQIIDQLFKLGQRHYYVAAAMLDKEKNVIDLKKYTREYDIQECSKYPICSRKIVFYAMGRYSGHGKAITESLLSLDEKLDIVWIVMEEHLKANVPERVRLVCASNRRKLIYEMETAKCWVYEHPVPKDYIKRPEQYYIQVKHWSSITLKTFGCMLHEFRNEQEAVEQWRHNGKIMDYVFVGSNFDEETCRRGFCFDKEVIRVGSPRSDILFRSQGIKNKIFELFHIDPNVKIALYAPTFRFTEDGKASKDILNVTKIDFFQLKQALERKFGGSWMVFLRFHPLNHLADGHVELPLFVRNVTDYEDGEELVASSEVMITDYSSIMFEPLFVKKPVFLYAPDRDRYINQERELLLDYDSLPFDIVESNEELGKAILSFDIDKYREKLESFMKKYGVYEDGHASERAARFILNLVL